MAQSRQALVYRALYNLGVLPQGQNPGNEEYNAVDGLVDPMLEELIAKDVAFIEDVEAIEDKYFLALGAVLAGHAAPVFGFQNDIALATRALKGEQDLERISAMKPTFGVLEIMPY
jgi:hypothetical protein